MKKIFKFLLPIALLGATYANALTEGVEYVKLEKPIDVGKNTLVKVFSYDCPACYRFDKGVTTKLVNSLEGVKFIPMHLSTKGDYGESASRLFAVLIQKDEDKGVSLVSDDSLFKKAKMAIYRADHDKGEKWLNKNGERDKEAFIKTGLDAAGVSYADYEAALNTPQVQERLAKWEANAYDVASVQGVPAYVVSGKYLINAASAGSIHKLTQIISELINK